MSIKQHALDAFVRAFDSPLNRPDETVRQFLWDISSAFDGHRSWVVTCQRSETWERDDPLMGWDIVATINPIQSPEETAMVERWMKEKLYRLDPFTVANVQRFGKSRIARLCDLLGDEHWSQTLGAELLDVARSGDRIVGVHSLLPTIELHLGVDRHEHDGPFTVEDAEAMMTVVERLRPVAGRLALTYGILPGQQQLAARERETLLLLLQDLSEREIASELAVAESTAHQYVVRVYRKLGVSSRRELLLKWLDPMGFIQVTEPD